MRALGEGRAEQPGGPEPVSIAGAGAGRGPAQRPAPRQTLLADPVCRESSLQMQSCCLAQVYP